MSIMCSMKFYLNLSQMPQFQIKMSYLEERFQKEYFGFSDPTFDYSLKYRRKMQQMFEGEYEFENVRYEADASLHYIVNDITIDSLYQYTSVHSSTLASTSAALSELQGGIRIPEARMKVIGNDFGPDN